MTTAILYGPQGSGKTRLINQAVAHFGFKQVVDEWSPSSELRTGTLYITNSTANQLMPLLGERDDDGNPVLLLDIDALKRLIPAPQTKDTNPKDAVGIRKWRQFTCLPMTVMAYVGVALLEGARKYGRHNYRVAGVRSSVYIDAAMGHLIQYQEGEDIDADSGLRHPIKAIASLIVHEDAHIQDMLTDDRPPKAKLEKVRLELQKAVDDIFDKWPDPVPPFTEQEFAKDVLRSDVANATIPRFGASGGLVGDVEHIEAVGDTVHLRKISINGGDAI